MSASVSIVTPAASHPLLLDDVKLFLRIDASDEDSLLSMLLSAATEYVEGHVGQALITQTRKLTLDKFPADWTDWIRLPYPPLSSVSSVKYYYDETLTIWDSANYEVDTDDTPGRIRPSCGNTWPSTDDRLGAVEITYVCGYGASYTSVPNTLRVALMQLVHDWYTDRTAEGKSTTGYERLITAASHGGYLL